MISWTTTQWKGIVEAFNGGEKQSEIALRLGTTRKAVSRVLCRARERGIFVERRSGKMTKEGTPPP